jgi:hypothetical protein
MKNYLQEHNDYIDKMVADFPTNDFQPKRRKNTTVNQLIRNLEYTVAGLIGITIVIAIQCTDSIAELLF